MNFLNNFTTFALFFVLTIITILLKNTILVDIDIMRIAGFIVVLPLGFWLGMYCYIHRDDKPTPRGVTYITK